ncbi:GDSL-like Lipase/Acylhydrolase superfamily protein [Actinidia rufa]|uniref:GDSL-like Lipase/Acylhydrolase superfamily protein n=1 Tax=Actinidia rufa TaxID=165716 RepID=A0A7J0EL45_9ERIC|nr:GDSL-like Lipase/Acylhydrolase superfamily protein [Actinidia rufa]
MESRLAIWVVVLVLVGGENGGVSGSGPMSCGFPAIFNFGDSNSDTGSMSSAGGENQLPLGMSVGKKFKRACDGRLIIDFLGKEIIFLCNRYITASKSLNSYAFKSRTTALYTNTSNDDPLVKSSLPEPEVFSNALYTIDIGQNDIAYNFDLKSKPEIFDRYYDSLQRLLDNGAKFVWVHNTGPFGCLARIQRSNCTQDGSPCPAADEHGCLIQWNNVAQEVNALIKDRVYKLRAKYPDAVITLVDVYSAKYSLFGNPKSQGFDEPFNYCCGSQYIWCGGRELEVAGTFASYYESAKLINATCNNPSKYISWDGVHYTEAANRIVANLIASGTFSDPPVPISEACHK